MVPWWIILICFGLSIVVQVVIGLTTIALVHDMTVKAYRQLWREQQAAILLHEQDLEDTPPAEEAESVH